jgi:hypothetical protein
MRPPIDHCASPDCQRCGPKEGGSQRLESLLGFAGCLGVHSIAVSCTARYRSDHRCFLNIASLKPRYRAVGPPTKQFAAIFMGHIIMCPFTGEAQPYIHILQLAHPSVNECHSL